ncbi:MAG: glycosyltransferase family 39 protein [Phycisphaerales bacterium]|nr:glycosyltransferase family 39 protein [Phycisphaerales bacterium]MCB9862189.1 glycosyltransferase family 39 protein [Phycisphaerales bacterium]
MFDNMHDDNANPMTPEQVRSPRWAIVLLVAVTIAGTWLRLWNLGRHSLWLDEAWLANTLLSDSLSDVVFLGPGSAAPNSTPFLLSLAIHALTRILGDSEFVLRLVPALFSAGSVVTIWLLARRLGATTFTALFAAILIAFNPVSIEYAKELKQYAGDTFWIPLFLVAVSRFVDKPTWPFAVVLAFGTLIAFGFAQTIALALPGACFYMAIHAVLRLRSTSAEENPRALLTRSVVVIGIWLAGISAIYLLILRHQSSERLVAFWDEFFPSSASPGVLAPYAIGHIVGFFKWFFGWLNETLPNVRNNTGESLIAWNKIVIGFAAIGALRLAITRPLQLLTLVLMPGIVALTLSTQRMFPFGAVRVNLFMLPFTILLVAFSADAVCGALGVLRNLKSSASPAKGPWQARAARGIPPMLLGALAIALALPRIEKERSDPKAREELRPLVARLLDDYRKDDAVVLIDKHTEHAFKYYTRNAPVDYKILKSAWSDTVLLKSFANAAKHHRRIWIPVTHFNRGRIEEILNLLAGRWPNLAVVDQRDAILAFFDNGPRPVRVPPSDFDIVFPNGEDRAALATDGDPTTHWMSSSPREPGWQILIELKTPTRLDSIVLNTPIWPDDWSHELYAQVQTEDNDIWSSSGLSVWEGPRTTIRFEEIDAPIRRIRLTNAQQDPKFHWSIHELEIWSQSDMKKDATKSVVAP